MRAASRVLAQYYNIIIIVKNDGLNLILTVFFISFINLFIDYFTYIGHAAAVHPCAPDHIVPTGFDSSASSSAASAASTGSFSSVGNVEVESRNLLSKRFRYGVIEDLEIDDVNTGGAEVLIH
ncbi:hypothetical protein B5S33_g5053 [[Candida] boidinii]|nr:hypothetical protein B5S33_g5053 [[Candida] boidinii]